MKTIVVGLACYLAGMGAAIGGMGFVWNLYGNHYSRDALNLAIGMGGGGIVIAAAIAALIAMRRAGQSH